MATFDNIHFSRVWTSVPLINQQETTLSFYSFDNHSEWKGHLPSYEAFSSGLEELSAVEEITSSSSLNDSRGNLSTSFEVVDLSSSEMKKTASYLRCEFCGSQLTSKRHLNKHIEIHERENWAKKIERFFETSVNEEHADMLRQRRSKTVRPRLMAKARKNPY